MAHKLEETKEVLEEFGFWILEYEKDYDLTVSVKDTVEEFLKSRSA